jgi:hypothetical protein
MVSRRLHLPIRPRPKALRPPSIDGVYLADYEAVGMSNLSNKRSRAGKIGAKKSAWGRWSPCRFSGAISQDQIAAMERNKKEADVKKSPM